MSRGGARGKALGALGCARCWQCRCGGWREAGACWRGSLCGGRLRTSSTHHGRTPRGDRALGQHAAALGRTKGSPRRPHLWRVIRGPRAVAPDLCSGVGWGWRKGERCREYTYVQYTKGEGVRGMSSFTTGAHVPLPQTCWEMLRERRSGKRSGGVRMEGNCGKRGRARLIAMVAAAQAQALHPPVPCCPARAMHSWVHDLANNPTNSCSTSLRTHQSAAPTFLWCPARPPVLLGPRPGRHPCALPAPPDHSPVPTFTSTHRTFPPPRVLVLHTRHHSSLYHARRPCVQTPPPH